MSIQRLVRWSKVVVPVLLCLCLPANTNLFIYSDVEWVFADDERESNPTTFKFMAMAHAWKMSQAKNNDGGGGGDDGAASFLSGFTAAKASVEKEMDANSDVASSHGDESD